MCKNGIFELLEKKAKGYVGRKIDKGDGMVDFARGVDVHKA